MEDIKKLLSVALLEAGFIMVTYCYGGLASGWFVAERGRPFSHGMNNGWFVVYDEKGRPWAYPSDLLKGERKELILEYGLLAGAGVPTSHMPSEFRLLWKSRKLRGTLVE